MVVHSLFRSVPCFCCGDLNKVIPHRRRGRTGSLFPPGAARSNIHIQPQRERERERERKKERKKEKKEWLGFPLFSLSSSPPRITGLVWWRRRVNSLLSSRRVLLGRKRLHIHSIHLNEKKKKKKKKNSKAKKGAGAHSTRPTASPTMRMGVRASLVFSFASSPAGYMAPLPIHSALQTSQRRKRPRWPIPPIISLLLYGALPHIRASTRNPKRHVGLLPSLSLYIDSSQASA